MLGDYAPISTVRGDRRDSAALPEPPASPPDPDPLSPPEPGGGVGSAGTGRSICRACFHTASVTGSFRNWPRKIASSLMVGAHADHRVVAEPVRATHLGLPAGDL
jgi:hypothetical protein